MQMLIRYINPTTVKLILIKLNLIILKEQYARSRFRNKYRINVNQN